MGIESREDRYIQLKNVPDSKLAVSKSESSTNVGSVSGAVLLGNGPFVEIVGHNDQSTETSCDGRNPHGPSVPPIDLTHGHCRRTRNDRGHRVPCEIEGDDER